MRTRVEDVKIIQVDGNVDLKRSMDMALETNQLQKGLSQNVYYSYNGRYYLFVNNWKQEERTKYKSPVFIQGDSNISKYTTETAYSEREVIEGLHDVYK